MAGGYMGKYCIINLSNGAIEVVKVDESFYQRFLSGYGLGAAVIAQRQKPRVDPLSPESYLGFCSGLLAGSGVLFSGRFMVVGKSPLTGGWGDANAGGYLSREIKRSGYDAVFFTGVAQEPVWANINDDQIEINNAGPLWGKDTIETENALKAEQGNQKIQVACIGESGEKCSLISGISTDKGRMAARSGLGAVMGSKMLKAVVFSGKQAVPVARPEEVKEINRKFLAEYNKSKLPDRLSVRFMHFISQMIAKTGITIPAQASLVREIYREYGTPGLTVYSAMVGDMPIKNWSGVGISDYTVESAAKNSDENVLKYQRRKYACQSCPLACGGIIDIKKGRYHGTEGHKPEYETLGSFGGLLLHDDLDAIIELNEMCNRAGIDTISTGAAVAFATECFENNIINESDTGGLRLGWGKSEEIIKLTEMIIKREGIGDILADGVKRAANTIGQNANRFAMHAGGQELPMHDPRLDPGFAIAYQCEPTPGRHSISSYQYTNLYGVSKIFPKAKQMIKQAGGKESKKIKGFTAGTYYMQIVNSAGLCFFGAITSTLPLVAWLNAVTGWNLSPDEYFKTGERILNLRKAFNVREGIKPTEHKLSDRALGKTPLTKGPLKGAQVNMEVLMQEFYDTVGWDLTTGGPKKDKMKKMEINELFTDH
jgi:aldehyde:ferredoxin oxidoreductase